MNFLLQPILSYLLVYKYAALFAVTFLAALALPLPSAPSLMAAAAFAAQGYFSITLVIVMAVLGNVAGDNTSYWLSRRFGKVILYKIGLKKVLDSSTFEWMEDEVERYKAVIVFFSRFNALTTIPVNIVAGLSQMPYRPYLFYDVTGEVAQVLMYAAIGYFFGSDWQNIYSIFGKFSLVVIIFWALILVLISTKIKNLLLHRRDRHIEAKRKN